MHRRLIPAALCATAVLVLAGCGQDSRAAEAIDPATSDPATSDSAVPAGSPAAESPAAESPGDPGTTESIAQWPATGCDARSVLSVDYGRMPTGYATPEEAVTEANVGGIPEGEVVLAPAEDKGPARVWVLDPETQEIAAEVTVFRGPEGWFVDGVITCG